MFATRLLSVIALSFTLAFSIGAHAEDDEGEDTGDWLCDRLSSLQPPPGCAVIAGVVPVGLCITLSSGDPWNCLGSWIQIDPTKTLMQSAHPLQPGLALPQPEGFALLAPQDQARRARLRLDTAAVHAAPSGRVPVFELGEGAQALHLSAERTNDGGVELVLRRPQNKATPAVARLALIEGVSTTLVEWRHHPVYGPQLVLDGHRGQVLLRMAKLDGHTRLQTWKVGGVELSFDLHASRID